MVMNNGGDSFISDQEEDLCPLCVEEMDLSDKNFKPCPCGYQVCQFCYNNIRQNLNGRCPACRRPYTDEAVEYKMITQEEWKQDHMRQTRKERERKQREREKKETEHTSKRHHLSGMRVIQKNLVYVIGLNPNIPTEELHNTLRGEQFFGQYGKIQKIVINRRTNANGNPGLGVYVTFARKEDAARCIAAVDGSMNDGKYLRAAYGTTKYCSSYLRGQPCPNPNCMFLHEPGEEADSYTRQDLSTIQHAQQQQGGIRTTSGTGATPPAPQPAAVVNRSKSSDEHDDGGESSALPAGVSWAHKTSPPAPHAKPEPVKPVQQHVSVPGPRIVLPNPVFELIDTNLKSLAKNSIEYKFSSSLLDSKDLAKGALNPTLFTFSRDVKEKKSSSLFDFKDGMPKIFSAFTVRSGLRRFNIFGDDLLQRPTEQQQQTVTQQNVQCEIMNELGLRTDNNNNNTNNNNNNNNNNTNNNNKGDSNNNNNSKAVTPPPPGLFSANPPSVQNQNSLELLAHLMKGSRPEH
jgi:CCR4-NOT transcription complex subunit 4